MKKLSIFTLALSLISPILWAQNAEKNSDLDAGVAYYAAGNLDKAKESLLKVEWKGDANSRFVDFLLSDIAVKQGDWPLAKERFTRAFKNLPEGNEFLLAKNFATFCDVNKFYKFEVELLQPFYKGHEKFFESDSVLAWCYAKALFEIGKLDEAKAIVAILWKNFSKDPLADGLDELLFDADLGELAKGAAEGALNSDSPIESARAKIILGKTRNLEMPKELGMGLLLYFADNTDGVSDDDLEAAIENSPESTFAWRAWFLLAQRCFEQEQYELAYNFASRADTLAPDLILKKAKIYILIADCDRFLKRYEQAKPNYEKVMKSRECIGELAAEAIYKLGLNAYEQKKWNDAYYYFNYVFTAYEGFDYWSSRAYFYGAKAQLELGDNLGARNVLLYYLKNSKHRDTLIYNNAAALWSRIKIN